MTFLLSFLITATLHAQNIGIDAPVPTEKLEVGGMIFTNSGGIKFPDSTIQTTAALSANFEESAMERQYILMELDINGIVPGPDSAINIPDGIRVKWDGKGFVVESNAVTNGGDVKAMTDLMIKILPIIQGTE